MSQPVAASLVVCTRNRAERLPAMLERVAEIRSTRPWQLVVVDNGSSDRTAQVLEEHRSAFEAQLLVVREPVPGVSRARNRGWRSAAGHVIVFTDDDCYPAPDVIDRFLEHFERDPALGFVGGAVVLHDPADARLTTVAGSARWRLPPHSFVTAGELIAANLALRREALEQIGGLDEAFAYGSEGLAGGDLDLVARVSAAGWDGLFDPEIVVRHHHRRRDAGEVAAIRRSYDRGRGAVYAKCLRDPRLRRVYLKGWLALTAGRVRRRESLRPVVHELGGALTYLRRGRSASSGSAAT